MSEAATAIGSGTCVSLSNISGWSIDSRTLNPGDLFFALRGPAHDGHDHVRAAFERGAAGAVVDHKIPVDGAQLQVKDTLAAMQALAHWARNAWGGKVVGVTGSAGKTTTKDVIAHLLSTEFPTGRTVGNFNNHVGVPLSILRLPDECRVAVLEIGMNHAGEIRELAAIAKPDIGVVSNVGYAHIEFFGSIDEIALAKRELIEALPPDGTAVLNADDERVRAFATIHKGRVVTFGLSESADVRAENVEMANGRARFICEGVDFDSPLTGRHGVSNVLAGIAVAQVFGIPATRLRDAVRTLSTGKMRGERIEHEGITILNDSYNSNPEAVRSMVDVLAQTPARRRIAVLGEMLELGTMAEALHRGIGRYVAERGIDVLIGIRGAARSMVEEAVGAGMSGAAYFFETPARAGDLLRDVAHEGDAVLFKGSRGVQVEKALDQFLGARQ